MLPGSSQEASQPAMHQAQHQTTPCGQLRHQIAERSGSSIPALDDPDQLDQDQPLLSMAQIEEQQELQQPELEKPVSADHLQQNQLSYAPAHPTEWQDTGPQSNSRADMPIQPLVPGAAAGNSSDAPTHSSLDQRQGIGRFRHQHKLLTAQIDDAASAEASQSAALPPATAPQPSRKSLHDNPKSSPQQPTGSAAANETDAPQQVFRRRSSFKNAVKGGVFQRLRSAGRQHSDMTAPEGSVGLLPTHDNSSSSSSLVHRLMSMSLRRSSKVGPQLPAADLLGLVVDKQLHERPQDGEANVDQPLSLPHSSVLSSSTKRAKVSKIAKKGHFPLASMHTALQQSIAHVEACTLQLEQQHKDQQSMQKVLQVIITQTVAILDEAIATAVKQSWHHV